jgi:hypothetical protein
MSCAPILNKYQHPQRPMFEGSNFAPSKNNSRIPKTTITQCVLVGKEPNWQSTTTIRFAEVSLSGSPFNLTRVSPFGGYPFHLPFGTTAGSPFRGLPLFSLPIRIVLRGAFSPLLSIFLCAFLAVKWFLCGFLLVRQAFFRPAGGRGSNQIVRALSVQPARATVEISGPCSNTTVQIKHRSFFSGPLLSVCRLFFREKAAQMMSE